MEMRDITTESNQTKLLKKVFKQVLNKVRRAGCDDVDPSVANLLTLNLPHTITPVQFKSFLEEIDQQGEFQSMEEARKFLDLLGVIFWGVDLRASPQVEDGFTRTANEIMEALARIRIPGEARQVLDFILRKLYGWHQKEDKIPLSQIVLGTGLKKPNICRAIRKLLEMNLIIVKDNGYIKIYRFQKDYSRWRPLSKKITLSKAITETPKSLSKKTTSKETLKERSNGRASKKKDVDPGVRDFLTYWGETFLQETGQPYTFSYGKEGRLVKDLLKVHSLETLQEVTRAFFKDEQCKRRGLTMGILFQEINRLLGAKAIPQAAYRDLTGTGRVMNETV